MALVDAPVLYREGLRGIAHKEEVGIPEATIKAIQGIIQVGKEDEIPEVIQAAFSLHPGDIHTQGLWGMAQVTKTLHQTATDIIAELNSSSSEEYIPPTEAAFTWFTGKEL